MPAESGQEKPADDVDKLLKELGISSDESAAQPQPSQSEESSDALFGQESIPSTAVQSQTAQIESKKVKLEKFSQTGSDKPALTVDSLKDVNLHLKVELGRSRMFLQEILKFAPGSIIELDKLTGDPLDIYVNDLLVARGEILVVNDNFAIRVTEIVNPVKN